MRHLYWYLAIGFPVSVWLILLNRSSVNNKLPTLKDYQDADFSVGTVILQDIIILALTVPVWPITLIFKIIREINDIRSEKADIAFQALKKERQENNILKVADFQEQLSIEEIEEREKVYDPLGAVPDLPFGHLNCVWQRFLSQQEPGDTIWSFKAHWKRMWGCKELMSGYAIKRGDEVGPHFFHFCKILDKD